MALCNVKDEQAPQDFEKILEDDESEDFNIKYEGEEHFVKVEGFPEGYEEVDTSVTEEMGVATSEMAIKAEPYDMDQQQHRPRRGGATQRSSAARRAFGGTAQRARRRALAQMPTGDPQLGRGEGLVEVFADDDDVPEEIRAKIMNIVNTRKVARERLLSKVRIKREENEEEASVDEIQSFFAVGTSSHFEWSPMGDFKGEREKFLLQQTGSVVAAENAYEAFRRYWDDDIMTHIVTETNRYAAGLASLSATFAQSWYDTNVHEIFILFSFWMMLGIIRMPSIKSCFTLNPILQTNIFRKMFTRLRYENLCRAFNLIDNNSRPQDTTDPLFVLGPIICHLNFRFQESYIPTQNICIGESLTLGNGNISEVKSYELCESSTGYLWSFSVYLGAGTSNDTGLPSSMLKSSTTIIQLIRPLLDRGYTLFMNKCFTSPLLVRFLKSRKTDCVGTLRVNHRTDVPQLVSLCDLKNGQFVARHSGDVVVMAFQDKKRKVGIISTYHGTSQGKVVAKPYQPPQYKLQAVLDYDKGMGGVNLKGQKLEPYLLERKRVSKWNVKFFKRLLNYSILNARVLLRSSTANPQHPQPPHTVFRLELVDQIMRHHLEQVPRHRNTEQTERNRPTAPVHINHFPRKTDQYTHGGRRLMRRRCTYCSSHYQIRRNTPYVCSGCQVPLCVDFCFEAFHTK